MEDKTKPPRCGAGCGCEQCFHEFVAYWREASPLVAEFGSSSISTLRKAFEAGAKFRQQMKRGAVLESLRS